jgi:TonB family protein
VEAVWARATTHESAAAGQAEPSAELSLLAETTARPHLAAKGKKGLLFSAIAAAVLLAVAGVTWYVRQGSAPAQQSTVALANPPAAASSAPAAPTATKPVADAAAAAAGSIGVKSIGADDLPPGNSSTSTSPTKPTAQPLTNSLQRDAAAELSAYRKLAEPTTRNMVQPKPKKPSLGTVHLAAPALTPRAASADTATPDLAPALNNGQVTSTSDALGAGLVAGSAKQPAAPAAPLPVGGDVKQARLMSSVPPLYPAIAKQQHIQGAVQIDALVDATGKVSSMRVVSGPVLLHQAAMDALRQWKYEAATLDGKPVAMHLAVTVQFKLQ